MKTVEETINYMANEMEVMRYYDNPKPKSENLKQKRQDMIDNKDNLYIATEKHDGDFGLFAHYKRGENLIRSRSISVKTGKYGDYTEKLPHLVEEMNTWPDNTVVLAEICWGEYGTNANTVGTILRCLPPKAVERQKEKKLVGKVFDMLMMNGEDMTNWTYEKRLNYVYHFFDDEQEDYPTPSYFSPTNCCISDFAEVADAIIAAGGEGLVIQLKSNPYMPGTRTAWKTLKLKQTLPHMDLKVIDTIEPNKYYDGDNIENWEYWYQDMPNANSQAGNFAVTKRYFMGWKNGVIVDFNGVKVSITSGVTDADAEWLTTSAAKKAIESGELYAEIKAMSVNDKGSLRHPALIRLRTDM